jgi:hypothetical protein
MNYDARTASDKHQLRPDIRRRFRPWITIMAIEATKPPAAAESLEFRALRSISDL